MSHPWFVDWHAGSSRDVLLLTLHQCCKDNDVNVALIKNKEHWLITLVMYQSLAQLHWYAFEWQERNVFISMASDQSSVIHLWLWSHMISNNQLNCKIGILYMIFVFHIWLWKTISWWSLTSTTNTYSSVCSSQAQSPLVCILDVCLKKTQK